MMTPLEIFEAKAHLAGWALKPGVSSPLADYGATPADFASANTWTARDGMMLSAFAQSIGQPATTTLTSALLLELRQSTQADITKFLPPSLAMPTSVPVVDPVCAAQCLQTHPTDPVAAAWCSAECLQNVSVPAGPAAGMPQPLPSPKPSPEPATEPAAKKTNTGWIVAGFVAGAALLYALATSNSRAGRSSP